MNCGRCSGPRPHPMDRWLAQACGAESMAALPVRLRAARTEALNRILRHAARHSAFYARHLAGCDLEMREPEDLARLPFTTAAHLRDWRDFCCVSQGDVQRMVSLQTSGTTGVPKRLAFTERDLDRTRDFFRVGMGQLVREGERLAVFLPGAERPDGVADLLRGALSPSGVLVEGLPSIIAVDMSPAGDASRANWLAEHRPQALVAAPAQLEGLLRSFPRAAPPDLRGVLSSTDRLEPDLKQRLRAAWSCELLDHYGLTESGFGCAVECPAHDGYHLRALDALLEVVDPRDGRPLPWGETGEVVLTTLHREAMPLIRYRTGDLASLLPGPCLCGSPLPRLGPLQGRLDMDAGQGVRVVHPAKGGGASRAKQLDAARFSEGAGS